MFLLIVLALAPQDELVQARERLIQALDRGDPDALDAWARKDRKYFHRLCHQLIEGYIERVAERRRADRESPEKLMAAFSRLEKLTQAEQRQLAAARARLDMAVKMSPEEAREFIRMTRVLGRSREEEAEKAAAHVEETLRYFEKLRDAHMLQIVYGDRAVLAENAGRREDALKYFELMTQSAREEGDGEGEMIGCLHSGVLLRELKRLEEAVRRLKEGLNLARETNRREQEGSILGQLGECAWDQSRFLEAVEYYRAALERPADPDEKTALWQRIGIMHRTMGAWEEALRAYRELLALERTAQDASGAANTLSWMADAFRRLGRYREAMRHQNRALKLAEQGKDARLQAFAWLGIGEVFADAGVYEEALRRHTFGLKFALDAHDEYATAMAWTKIGSAFIQCGYPRDAARPFQSALEIFRKLGQRGEEANVLANLGTALGHAGKFDEALAHFERALEILRQDGDADRQAILLGNIARMKLDVGKTEEAVLRFEEALRIAESMRTSLGMLEEEKSGWFDRFRYLYESAAEAYLAQQRPDQAVRLLELMRARNLLDALERSGAGQGDVPGELLKRKLELRTLYNVRRSAMAGSERPDAAELRKLEGQLTEVEHQIEQSQGLEEARPLGSEEIQKTLGEDEALVLYTHVHESEKLLAAVLTRDTLRVIRLEARMIEGAAWLREAVRATARGYPAKEYRTRAYAVYEALIKPLNLPSGVRRLILAPDEALYTLPFEALVESNEGESYSELKYLGRRLIISYSSSGTLLAKRRSKSGAWGDRVAAFGDPDYGGMAGAAAERGQVPEDLRPYLKSEGREERGGWARLPHSGEEARAVAELFGAKPFLGAQASEKNVRGLDKVRYAHFACHGWIDREGPMRSALVLARDSENDGFLEAREVADLKLPAELVVLSACDSASGQVLRGEGVLGLTRAFLIAGARSVIASLWAVSDEAGKDFMVGFYRKLASGKKAPEALALTRREFMGQDMLAAPYYWAGFVLYGD